MIKTFVMNAYILLVPKYSRYSAVAW